MFRLTAQEAESLRCQIGTSKRGGQASYDLWKASQKKRPLKVERIKLAA